MNFYQSKYKYLILIFVSFIIYYKSFFVPFIGDSHLYFTETIEKLPKYFFSDVIGGYKANHFYRPLVRAYYFLNYHFFKYNYFFYHLVNFIIFWIACFISFNFMNCLNKNYLLNFYAIILFVFSSSLPEIFNWFLGGSADILNFLLITLNLYYFYKFLKEPKKIYIFLIYCFQILSFLVKENHIIIFPFSLLLYFIYSSKSYNKKTFFVLFLILLFQVLYFIFRFFIFDGIGGYDRTLKLNFFQILENFHHNNLFLLPKIIRIDYILYCFYIILFFVNIIYKNKFLLFISLSYIISFIPILFIKIINVNGFGGRYLIFQSFYFSFLIIYIMNLILNKIKHKLFNIKYLALIILIFNINDIRFKNYVWNNVGNKAKIIENRIKSFSKQRQLKTKKIYLFNFDKNFKDFLLFLPDIKGAISFWLNMPLKNVYNEEFMDYQYNENNCGINLLENFELKFFDYNQLNSYIKSNYKEIFYTNLNKVIESKNEFQFKQNLIDFRDYTGLINIFFIDNYKKNINLSNQSKFEIYFYYYIFTKNIERKKVYQNFIKNNYKFFYVMLGSEKDLFLRYCYLYDLDFFNFLINKLECRNLNKKILYIFGENVLYNTDFTLKRRRLENLKQLSILKKCYNEAILRTDLNIFEYIKYYKLLKIQLFFGDED